MKRRATTRVGRRRRPSGSVGGAARATGGGVWPAGKDAGRGVVRARRRGPRVGVAPPAPALARTADALDHARGRRDGDAVLHHIFF